MAGKKKTFKLETIEKLGAFLDTLPEKPKQEKEKTASEVIGLLKTRIKSLQTKGYTLEEIIELFRKYEVDIGLSALKNAIKKPRQKKIIADIKDRQKTET
uniref:hypothetical protein n=1 Tax=Sulfuriferula sp. GW6 TaxID=3345112 RepID=UPI0039F73D03